MTDPYDYNITDGMKLWYEVQVDSRTVGKTTKNLQYKGVLRVDYFNTKAQIDLESLINLIYNQVLRARRIPVVRNYGIVQTGFDSPTVHNSPFYGLEIRVHCLPVGRDSR